MTNFNMLPIGTKLKGGEYEITSHLKSGGFGNTYVVKNKTFKTFALKEFFIKRDGLNTRTGNMVTVSNPAVNTETYEIFKKKFEHEVQRVKKIHNRHIVRMYDLFRENNTVYCVMEYVDGCSVRELLDNSASPMSENSALQILYEMLDALSDVHKNGIVHADITPNNIMIKRNGDSVLIDFGSSKEPSGTGGHTTFAAVTNTPGYAPIEQMNWEVKKMGPWTDLYSLGATLYNMLSGQSPTMVIENGEKAFVGVHVSDDLKKLILWMMGHRITRIERPQSVSEVKSYLQQHNLVYKKNTLSVNKPTASNIGIDEKKKVGTLLYNLLRLNGVEFAKVTCNDGNPYLFLDVFFYTDEQVNRTQNLQDSLNSSLSAHGFVLFGSSGNTMKFGFDKKRIAEVLDDYNTEPNPRFGTIQNTILSDNSNEATTYEDQGNETRISEENEIREPVTTKAQNTTPSCSEYLKIIGASWLVSIIGLICMNFFVGWLDNILGTGLLDNNPLEFFFVGGIFSVICISISVNKKVIAGNASGYMQYLYSILFTLLSSWVPINIIGILNSVFLTTGLYNYIYQLLWCLLLAVYAYCGFYEIIFRKQKAGYWMLVGSLPNIMLMIYTIYEKVSLGNSLATASVSFWLYLFVVFLFALFLSIALSFQDDEDDNLWNHLIEDDLVFGYHQQQMILSFVSTLASFFLFCI